MRHVVVVNLDVPKNVSLSSVTEAIGVDTTDMTWTSAKALVVE